jgi:hypothetical protein
MASLQSSAAPASQTNTAIYFQQIEFIRHKYSKIIQSSESLPIISNRLPSFTPMGTVALMKTAHTLILLRQHRCLDLVSARLPG